MGFLLSFENKGFPGGCVATNFVPPGRSDIVRFTGNPKSILTNDEINGALADGRPWHMSTNLIVTLTPDATERSPLVFINTHGGTFLDMRVWFRQSSDSPTGFLRDTFAPSLSGPDSGFSFSAADSVLRISESGNQLEINTPERLQSLVDDHFTSIGVDRPVDGFVSLALGVKQEGLPDGSATYHYYLVKCTFTPPVLAPPGPPAARTTDTSFAIGNYVSKPEPYETLFVPSLTASFHYNFYRMDEESLLASYRKGYAFQPISKIPKYVELFWSPAPIITEGDVAPTEGCVYINGRVICPDDREVTGQFFGSKASSARLAQTVGDDTTLSFGLTELESNILDESIRRSDDPDAIVGPNEFSRYIGYVIFKERYNDEEDVYEPLDLIVILDRRKNRIIDTKIAYGDRYRYTVRSVYKFVNVDNLPLFQDPDTIIDKRDVTMVFDGGTELRYAYYFDSKFSNSVDILIHEENRPNAPYNIKVFANSSKGSVFVTWNTKDSEKDIKGFNIYRKVSNSRFSRINTNLIKPRNNFYIDSNLEVEKDYVYAVESIDQHENASKLSTQHSIRLGRSAINQNVRTESKSRVFINKELELMEDGPLSPKESEVIRFKDKLKLLVNPLFPDLNQNFSYLLKITSLDTFMEKEFKLKFDIKTVDHAPEERSEMTLEGISRQATEGVATEVRGALDISRSRPKIGI